MRLGRNFRQRQPGAALTQARRTLSTILAATPGSHWWDMRYTGSSPQLFQDAAGTTPVTAVGQYLGLCLDKPAGSVQYGAELASYAAMTPADASWVVGASSATAVNGINYGVSQPCLVSGKMYKVTVTTTAWTAGNIRVRVGTIDTGVALTGVGVQSGFAIANNNQLYLMGSGTFSGTVKISCVEVIGTPLTQSTTTKRPEVRARVNLLTATEDFSSASWVKGGATTATANIVSFPNNDWVYQLGSTTYPASISVVFSVLLAGTGVVKIHLYDNITGTGQFTQVTLTSTPTRYAVTGAFAAGSTDRRVGIGTLALGAVANVGITKADLRPASTPSTYPAYQRVTSATDYDVTGFPALPKFDGNDDALTTGAITLGASMDCFMVLRRDSAAQTVLAYDGNSKFLGEVSSATSSCVGNAGSPLVRVDGALIASPTAANLSAAMPVGAYKLVEFSQANLSTWASANFGFYANSSVWTLNGSIPEVILTPALSDADRTIVRKELAAKYGITLA